MLKESVNGKSVLLQDDFSENASLHSQNESQSYHWSHGQATVFTGYAWIANGISESSVIVSDEHSTIKSMCTLSLVTFCSLPRRSIQALRRQMEPVHSSSRDNSFPTCTCGSRNFRLTLHGTFLQHHTVKEW